MTRAGASFDADGEMVQTTIDAIQRFVSEYTCRSGETTAAEIDPDIFADLLDDMMEAAERKMDPRIVTASVDGYLHYLHERGLWTATDENFEAVHSQIVWDGGVTGKALR